MSEIETAGEAIVRMADEFAQLAKVYMDMRAFKSASRAAAMAQALMEFENGHIVTEAVWPAQLAQDEYERPCLSGCPHSAFDGVEE